MTTPAALPELLPCPFCGSAAKYECRSTYERISAEDARLGGLGYSAGGISTTTHKVHCTAPWTCYASVIGQTEANAYALWNTRAQAPKAGAGAWRLHYPEGKRSAWHDASEKCQHYGALGKLIDGPHPDCRIEYAYTTPPASEVRGLVVTDAMVEAACVADWGSAEWAEESESKRAAERIHMRQILRAALSAALERKDHE